MNWTAILYGLLAAILALGIMYLDTKLLDNPKSKATYIKGMTMTGAITGLIIYFMGGSSGIASSSGGTHYFPGLSEEIITGPPNF